MKLLGHNFGFKRRENKIKEHLQIIKEFIID